MYVVAMIATIALRTNAPYFRQESAVFVVDILLLAGLVWLSLTVSRFWPIPSAACHGISCLAHFARLIEPNAYRLGYQLLAEASTYPVLILLAIGVWRQQVRTMQRKQGR